MEGIKKYLEFDKEGDFIQDSMDRSRKIHYESMDVLKNLCKKKEQSDEEYIEFFDKQIEKMEDIISNTETILDVLESQYEIIKEKKEEYSIPQ